MPAKPPFIFIAESQVQKFVDLKQGYKAIEKSYQLFSAGKTTTPKTIAMKINDGMFFAFPSFLNGHKYFICKLATFYSKNRAQGLPSIQPNIFVYDSHNGSLVGIISARYFAGVRTAITSAVGVKYLAIKNPRKLAIIGSGVQARSHALVLSALFPSIKNIVVFSPDAKNREKFVSDVKAKIKSSKLIAEKTSGAAVRDADIIACVTDSPRPVFDGRDIKPGVCILAVGSMGKEMQEVSDEVMENALVVVDSLQQVGEYGEIEGPKMRGKQITVLGEIGNVITKKDESARGKTVVFKHHGLPVTDVALAESILEKII